MRTGKLTLILATAALWACGSGGGGNGGTGGSTGTDGGETTGGQIDAAAGGQIVGDLGPTGGQIVPDAHVTPADAAQIADTGHTPADGAVPDAHVAPQDAAIPVADAHVATPDAFVAPPDAQVPTADAFVPPADALIAPADGQVPVVDAVVPVGDVSVPLADASVPAGDGAIVINCALEGSFRVGDIQCCDGLVPACPYDMYHLACGAPCSGSEVCTHCGNGFCGAGEDACNCPADCHAVVGCVDAGQPVDLSPGHPQCCPNLVVNSGAGPNPDGSCPLGGVGASWVCLAVGDGNCGAGENICNSHADCVAAPPCSATGATVEPVGGSCCDPAAVMIGDAFPDAANNCQPGQGLLFCALCGNGVCEPGENMCSCGGDCPPPVN